MNRISKGNQAFRALLLVGFGLFFLFPLYARPISPPVSRSKVGGRSRLGGIWSKTMRWLRRSSCRCCWRCSPWC